MAGSLTGVSSCRLAAVASSFACFSSWDRPDLFSVEDMASAEAVVSFSSEEVVADSSLGFLEAACSFCSGVGVAGEASFSGCRDGWGEEEQLQKERKRQARGRRRAVIINLLFFTGYELVFIPSLVI